MLEALVFIRKNLKGSQPGIFIFFHGGDEFVEVARFVDSLYGHWEDRCQLMSKDSYERIANRLLDENNYRDFWTITLTETVV